MSGVRIQRHRDIGRQTQQGVQLVPAGKLLALQVVDLRRGRLQRGKVGRGNRQRLVAGGDGLLRLVVAGREQIAIARQQGQRALGLDDIDRQQPGLADHLPFLPEDLRVDLRRAGPGRSACAGQGDQRADVLADAGVPGGGGADAGDQRQEGAGELGIGQQPGLQHLRLRHAMLRPGRPQIGIVLHRQQRDLRHCQLGLQRHPVVAQAVQAVSQRRPGRQRQISRGGAARQAQRPAAMARLHLAQQAWDTERTRQRMPRR